jgi:hypothetical protein
MQTKARGFIVPAVHTWYLDSNTLLTTGSDTINIYQGTWGEGMNSKSSNFKEFGNFVAKLTLEGKHGRLDGTGIFFIYR